MCVSVLCAKQNMRAIWLVGAVIAVLVAASYAEVTFGFAHSEYGFAFLGKFCFVRFSIQCTFQIEFEVSTPVHIV
jgi:hypothetical protein